MSVGPNGNKILAADLSELYFYNYFQYSVCVPLAKEARVLKRCLKKQDNVQI